MYVTSPEVVDIEFLDWYRSIGYFDSCRVLPPIAFGAAVLPMKALVSGPKSAVDAIKGYPYSA
jgi:hypothetical protein